MLITKCMRTCFYPSFSFLGNKSTNEIHSILMFVAYWLVEKKEENDEMNITSPPLSLSFSCQFNNPPLRRRKNATPAEKSTSYIHHHLCRRHFCLVECVNFKRRNKSVPSSFFFLSLKKHIIIIFCALLGEVLCGCLHTFIRTFIYTQLLFSLLRLIYIWHS
jgi:hypothetical protein